MCEVTSAAFMGYFATCSEKRIQASLDLLGWNEKTLIKKKFFLKISFSKTGVFSHFILSCFSLCNPVLCFLLCFP